MKSVIFFYLCFYMRWQIKAQIKTHMRKHMQLHIIAQIKAILYGQICVVAYKSFCLCFYIIPHVKALSCALLLALFRGLFLPPNKWSQKFKKILKQLNFLSQFSVNSIFDSVWGLSSYHHISMKMCDKIVTPLFHFDHIPTQVPKSLHRPQDSETEKILAHYWGG